MNLKKSCQGQKIRSDFLQLPDSAFRVRGLVKANENPLGLMLMDKRACCYFKYGSETCITIRQHCRGRLHSHLKSQF